MKLLIKNRNSIRSLLAVLATGNAFIHAASEAIDTVEPLGFYIAYNLICMLALFVLSKRQLSVEVTDQHLLVVGLLSTRKIEKARVTSIETQTYGSKYSAVRVCRLGVDGGFPIMLSETMFQDDDGYDKLLESLNWVSNKYLHQPDRDRKLSLFGFQDQLVTYCLALIAFILNVFIFVSEQGTKLSAIDYFALSKNIAQSQEYYRTVTAFFLHLNPYHLLVNLISLGVLGAMLEKHLGRARYFNLITLSAFFGWMASLAYSPFDLVVGASGGIFGLFGAYAILKIKSRGALKPSVDPMPFWWVGIILALQVLLDVYDQKSDFSAHIGGFLAGSLYLLVLGYLLKVSEKTETRLSMLIIFLGLISFSTLMF